MRSGDAYRSRSLARRRCPCGLPDHGVSIIEAERISQGCGVTSSVAGPDRAAVPDRAPATRRARAAAARPDRDTAVPADADKAAAPDRAPDTAPAELAVSGESERTRVLPCSA